MMAVASCGEIMRGLMAYGMEPNMPAAIIENGTLPEQRVFCLRGITAGRDGARTACGFSRAHRCGTGVRAA